MKALCYQCEPWRFVACRGLGRVWPRVYFSRLAPVRWLDVELPQRLPSGWARVQVRQCGLCASDVHLLRLEVSPAVAPSAVLGQSHDPVILGHEVVGTIEAIEGDTALRVGQPVISRSASFRNCFNLGAPPCAHCVAGEYAFCDRQGDPAPAQEPVRGGGYAPVYWEHAANLLPVPDALSDDEALLAEPLATSLRAVLALADRALGRVLVIGAGLQGLGAVHWLKCLRPEAEVTCQARYGFQAELARTLGARHAFTDALRAADVAQHLRSRLARGVGGNDLVLHGFDAVVDSIGSAPTIHAALRWTRPGGVVVVLGAHLYPGRLDYSPVWFREVLLRGVYAHGVEQFAGRRVSTLALAQELLATHGRLPVALVTHRLPLADYRSAVALLDHKTASRAVRIALLPAQKSA